MDAFRLLWYLGNEMADLQRATIAAIALLAAFLTVVHLWRIPPGRKSGLPSADAATAKDKDPEKNGPFTSNYGRTVMAGLSGLIAATFVNSFWEQAGDSAKAYYLLLFVIAFIALLLVFSVLQGLREGLRSRIAISARYRPPGAPRRPVSDDDQTQSRSKRFRRWLRYHSDLLFYYWGERLWPWLLSWRESFFVAMDTTLSYMLGRNQLRTALFTDEIVEYQEALLTAVGRIRREINKAVLAALEKAEDVESPDAEAIRVNISVMSVDKSKVFYISWQEGSLRQTTFSENSVAWVAVNYGLARWWKGDYPEKTILFDIKEEGRGELRDYFQPRRAPDYKAFIVIPVPWARRGLVNPVKGAIHISFSDQSQIDALWKGLEKSKNQPNYELWKHLLTRKRRGDRSLGIRDSNLGFVLTHSAAILGSLLRGFNESVFKSHFLEEDLTP